jgi:hypothetical protein
MAEIYKCIHLNSDKHVGSIDQEGKIFARQPGLEEYIGWIDYEDGEVYNREDIFLGWVEDDGGVVAHYDEEDIDLGYVTDGGELYLYDDEDEIYVGKVVDMEDSVEGAAALLLFFDEEEE